MQNPSPKTNYKEYCSAFIDYRARSVMMRCCCSNC